MIIGIVMNSVTEWSISATGMTYVKSADGPDKSVVHATYKWPEHITDVGRETSQSVKGF